MTFGFRSSALAGACLLVAIGALGPGQGLPQVEAAEAGLPPGPGPDPDPGLGVALDQGELVTVRLPLRKLSFSCVWMSSSFVMFTNWTSKCLPV